jgi:very-short-patch-repair endonuclease
MRGEPSLRKRSQYLRRGMTDAKRARCGENFVVISLLLGDGFGDNIRSPHTLWISRASTRKLIVEVEGGQHADSRNQERDSYLQRRGWSIGARRSSR